jgi:hypothetical protein
MNLQVLINNRLPLNNQQRASLTFLLTRGCHSAMATVIRGIVNNTFYSAFDGKEFTKDFNVRADIIEYKGRQKMGVIRNKLVENNG